MLYASEDVILSSKKTDLNIDNIRVDSLNELQRKIWKDFVLKFRRYRMTEIDETSSSVANSDFYK